MDSEPPLTFCAHPCDLDQRRRLGRCVEDRERRMPPTSAPTPSTSRRGPGCPDLHGAGTRGQRGRPGSAAPGARRLARPLAVGAGDRRTRAGASAPSGGGAGPAGPRGRGCGPGPHSPGPRSTPLVGRRSTRPASMRRIRSELRAPGQEAAQAEEPRRGGPPATQAIAGPRTMTSTSAGARRTGVGVGRRRGRGGGGGAASEGYRAVHVDQRRGAGRQRRPEIFASASGRGPGKVSAVDEGELHVLGESHRVGTRGRVAERRRQGRGAPPARREHLQPGRPFRPSRSEAPSGSRRRGDPEDDVREQGVEEAQPGRRR